MGHVAVIEVFAANLAILDPGGFLLLQNSLYYIVLFWIYYLHGAFHLNIKNNS